MSVPDVEIAKPLDDCLDKLTVEVVCTRKFRVSPRGKSPRFFVILSFRTYHAWTVEKEPLGKGTARAFSGKESEQLGFDD